MEKQKYSELKARAKEYALGCYRTYKNRAGLEGRWTKNLKIYHCLSTAKYYQGAANLFPPETRSACKALTDFAEEALFSSNDYVRVKGVGGAGDNAAAAVIQTLTEVRNAKIDFRRKVRDMLETLPILGMSIVKVHHKIRQKYVVNALQERVKLKNAMKGEVLDDEIIKVLKTLYDNTDFEPKALTAMFWDYMTPWEEQECIIERQEVTESYLRLMAAQGVFENVQNIFTADSSLTEKKAHDASKAYVDAYIGDLVGLSNDDYKPAGKRYELLEAWCNFDLDGDGIDEECVCTIVDGEYVVRFAPNPYDVQEKPYLWVPWEHVKGTSLGIGIPQICEKDQIALNDFVNQIMDNITAILNNMWIVDKLANIPKGQLKSRPHGVIESEAGTAAVQPVRPPLTANEGMRAVAMTKDHIRQASGATANLQGMPARYDTTATEASQMSNSSMRDVFSKLRDIEDRILLPFYKLSYSYDRQFMSREEFIKVVGQDAAATVLRPDATSLRECLLEDRDFIALGVTQFENKVVKLQQLINFLNVVGGLPQAQGVVDFPKLIEKIWKYGGDGDTIILPEAKAVLIAPEDENILMAQNEPVSVKPAENHQAHIQAHMQAILAPEQEQMRQSHIALHLQALNALQMGGARGVQPQNQPRVAPDMMTEANVGKMPDMPVAPEGVMI